MPRRNDKPFRIDTNNLYCHEIRTNSGESIPFVNFIWMAMEKQKFYFCMGHRDINHNIKLIVQSVQYT